MLRVRLEHGNVGESENWNENGNDTENVLENSKLFLMFGTGENQVSL